MALLFGEAGANYATMSENDHGSAAAKSALDALASGDFKKALEEALSILSSAGIPIALVQQVATASFALGRADAENQSVQPQAIDFLEVIASEPMAPEAFKTLRKSLRISQTNVGKLCGVTHAAVSDWERGIAPMPAQALHALMILKNKNLKKLPEELEEIITGNDLRALRKDLGIRQKDLAAELGVSLPAIEKWEWLASKPLAPKTVRRIRQQLDALRARAAEATA